MRSHNEYKILALGRIPAQLLSLLGLCGVSVCRPDPARSYADDYTRLNTPCAQRGQPNERSDVVALKMGRASPG
jgi:hypothetical protein